MTRDRLLLVVLPAALGALGLLTGPGLLTVAAIWWLAACLMPGATLVRRACYGAISLYAATASVLTVLALVDVRCSPTVLASSYLAMLVLLELGPCPPRRTGLLDRHDAWALGLAFVTTALIAFPLIGASPGEVMLLLSQTTDGGTHVQMVLGTAHREGYLSFQPVPGMREGMETYPGGWAGNTWIVGDLLRGGRLSAAGTVQFVAATVAATYGFLTFLAGRLSLALAHSLRTQLDARDEGLVTALVGLSTTAGLALFFLNLNSFTQVVAIGALLLAVLLLWEESDAPRTYGVLAACAVALAQSWYLIAPILGAVVVVALARVPARRGPLVILGITVAALASFPVLTGPGGHQVTARGAQLLPTLVGLLGLLLAGGIALVRLASKRGTQSTLRLTWAACFVTALLLECVLLPFRPDDVPGTSYYAGKVLLVLLLLAAVAAAGSVVGRTSARTRGSLAIVLGLLAGTWSTHDRALPPALGHVPPSRHAQELDALLARHPDGLPRDVDAWVLDGCSRVGDLIASKWMYDLSLTWTNDRATAIEDYVYDGEKSVDMLARRANEPGVRAVEVVVGRNCHPEKVAELARNPKVTVIRVP